ncbi:MAG: prepilin peptidase [Phascolarctobacterium sp.]|nr:prepilin peptidase [Phascolarctobacterium sp.]
MKFIYYILLAIFTGCLLIHSYTDYKEQLLYDKVSTVLMVTGVIYAYCYGDLWQSVYGAMASVGIMLVIYWVSRGGMGLGDVKLAFTLGVWLGLAQSLACLLLAFVAGGVIGVALLATGLKNRRDAIPFGPYLCVSGWVCLFYGTDILNLYWQLWQ